MKQNAETKQLQRIPAWGTMSQRDYEFTSGSAQLKTRKAIKAALEAGETVMYKRIKRRKYNKASSNEKHGSKFLTCACGRQVKVDANAEGVTCAVCTNQAAYKRGGFIHSRTVAAQEPRKEKEMASKKKNKKEKNKSSHMSVESIRARFDSPAKGRKRGFFVKVFSTLKSAKETTVQELAEKVGSYKSCPDKYKDSDKLQAQIRFYSKSIWGKRTGMVKVDGDTLTYVPADERE